MWRKDVSVNLLTNGVKEMRDVLVRAVCVYVCERHRELDRWDFVKPQNDSDISYFLLVVQVFK